MSGAIGGSKSENENKNQFSDEIWGDQGDALKDLWGQAGDLFGGGDEFRKKIGEQAGYLDPYNKDLMDRQQRGQEGLLGGGSYGDTEDIRKQLLDSMKGGGSDMGRMYEDIIGGPGNTYMDPMVDAMKRGSMENRDMMQAGNAQDAASMGQGGGSRQAMEDAMTNRATNRDMLDKETAMRGGGYGTDMDWKMRIAQQADQGGQANQDRLLEMLRGSDENKRAGMGYGRDVQDIGYGSMNPWDRASQGGWDQLNQWKGLIGDPTKLGSGSGSGSGSSKGGETSGSIGKGG